jgi:galactonate dehydratase
MCGHLCASVPNVRIMEIDVDGVPWRDDIISEPLRIENGHLILPKAPGLGADLNVKEITKHPWSAQSNRLRLQRVRGS